MDLLLDINIAVDICTRRAPFFEAADLAVTQCTSAGGRLWLYAGSVQTLEYVTRSELRRSNANEGISATALMARQLECIVVISTTVKGSFDENRYRGRGKSPIFRTPARCRQGG